LAYQEQHAAFLLTLFVSLASDVLDGRLARWLNQSSEFGARLDSWGDFATYTSVPLCAIWLRPDLVASEAPFFWSAVAAYVLPVMFGFWKFGMLTSYHTRGAVISAYLIGISVLIVFAGGPTWPFRLAVLVLVLAELEEVAISAILPSAQTGVPGLGSAIMLRREVLVGRKH